MNNQVSMPCPTPNCGSAILFDPYQLLAGTQFACPNCHAAIALAPESRELVQDTMEKFEELKVELAKIKQDVPTS